jgi:type I restriction enzyme S subunit
MAEWKQTQVSEFLKERIGKYKPNDTIVTRLKRLNKIDFSGGMHFSDKSSKTDMIIAKKGDLVISGINVAKGALAVYDDSDDITATIHYSSYLFDDQKINVEYFKRFLKSPKFIQLLKDQVKGGIKTEIKPKHLLPLKIDLPDIDTQKSIVDFFKRTENEIGDINFQISKQHNFIKQLRQSILQEAVEGKLTAEWRKQNPKLISGENHAARLLEKIKAEKERLIKEGKIKKQKALLPISEEEQPFYLPEGWVWCRLGCVADEFKYGSSKKSKKSGLIPVLRMGNLINGHIDWSSLVYTSDESEILKFLLKENDLLFNRTNSRELVGKTALFQNERESIYAGYLVRFHMLGYINPLYANYVMNSTLHRNWCDEVKTDALGQSNINATKLSNFSFPLPSISEQQAIVKKMDRLMAKIDALEEQVKSRKEQAEQLMQAALREAFNEG